MQIHELPFLSTGGGISDSSLLAVSKEEKSYKYAWSSAKSVMQTIASNAITAALATGGAIANAIMNAINTELGASFQMKSYDATYTCPANGTVGISANAFGMSTPAGYRPVAVYDLQTRHNQVVFRTLKVDASGSANALILVNLSGSEASQTATLGVLYAKTSMF